MCKQLISDRIVEGFSISQQTPIYDKIIQAMEEQRIAAKQGAL
jgi:hypothetical protein